MDERIRRLHKEAPLTDVHVHPSLKSYLFGRNLWRHYYSGGAFNPFASRSDFWALDKGGVGVIWTSHYLPERQLFRDCLWLRLAAMLLVPVYWKLTTGSLMSRLLEMMDVMEHEINRRPHRTELALSAADVTRIQTAEKIAVVHTVEGAHVLEGNVDNLDALAQRGVALLTLTHFYANGLTTQVNGMPEDMLVNKICPFNFQTGGDPPLTSFGRAILQKMTDLSMIVDVTHCTPEARRAVYAELNGERPIVATHVGVMHQNPDVYNLADDEIWEIARRGGAVGVIFMNYWLDRSNPQEGLPAIWRTIEHIHNVTSSWDFIMLGTDFDGFTDPPDDVPDAGRLGALTKLLLDHGLTDAEVKKILGQNAQRVLEKGWR